MVSVMIVSKGVAREPRMGWDGGEEEEEEEEQEEQEQQIKKENGKKSIEIYF